MTTPAVAPPPFAPPPFAPLNTRSGRGRMITFVLLAYVLAWAVALPMYLQPSLRQGVLFTVFATATMLTPTAALLISHRLFPADYRISELLGLNPGRPRRWLRPALIGWIGIPLAVLASAGLAILTGAFRPDFRGFSGYQQTLEAAGGAADGPGVATVVVVTLASAPLAAIVPNALFAAGEEFGWRGFLQPALSQRSQWFGIVVTGTIWGLWHAPLLLLGHNYPLLPGPLRLLFMVIACILLSGILGILHQTSGTVWVAALAHGTVNAWAGTPVLFADAGHPYRFAVVGILGVCGWVALAALFLILRRTIGRRTIAAESVRQPS